MKVRVQYKKGMKLGRAETDVFDADQIVRTVDGRIEICGAPKPMTWVRLNVDPAVGSTSLLTDTNLSAAGWRAGDRIVLPQTKMPPANGLNVYEGAITHEAVAKDLGKPFKKPGWLG